MADAFVAKGINGTLTVTPEKIIISRGWRPPITKEIYIESITAIQLFVPRFLRNGYIQFTFVGGNEVDESKPGSLLHDENAISIDGKRQTRDFIRAKELIEQYRAAQRHETVPHQAQEDPLDYLERLSNLMNKGIVTKEEFEAKKKQILGL